MVSEFTFIVLTYNHSQYIERHLDSIKNVIDTYGIGISVDLIVSDDCSHDDTIEKINAWLNAQPKIFRNITIYQSEKNSGIVHSIIHSIRICNTKFFKYLAGDDEYYNADLFTISEQSSSIVVTPIIPILELNATFDGLKENFRTLCYCVDHSMTNAMMHYDNLIAAPSTFVPCDLLRSEEYFKFISAYRNIEDIPTWQYMYFRKKLPIEIKYEPYIKYRIGSGISTSKKHTKKNAFAEERDRIYKEFRLRCNMFPKYINPWKYWYKWVRAAARKENKRNQNICNHDQLCKFYLD